MELQGKRAAGLAKQFTIPREGIGSRLGPDSVFAVKQIGHKGFRLLSPMHSEISVRGSLLFIVINIIEKLYT